MGKLAMSVDAAADEIGISETKIRKMINTGELESVRLGGRVLVTQDALRRLLKLDPELTEADSPDSETRLSKGSR